METPMRPAISADIKATASDARAPHSRRESTSRPNSSWPSQCCAEGPVSRAATSILTGSYGAIAGASSASKTSRPTSANGQPIRRQGSWARLPSIRLPVPHARVEHRIEEIDSQVQQDKQCADDEHDALHLRIVTLLHGADEEARQAGPVEHVFDEHGATEQRAH